MKPSAKWRATFLFLKIWKKVLKREIFGNVENRFVTHSKHAISDCPKPNIVLFLSAAESDIFRYNTFFYNCLHTHIRFTLPACLRPERFLSLCKSSYLFSGLACVKLLTISRRELIRNAAYFIKYTTPSPCRTLPYFRLPKVRRKLRFVWPCLSIHAKVAGDGKMFLAFLSMFFSFGAAMCLQYQTPVSA